MIFKFILILLFLILITSTYSAERIHDYECSKVITNTKLKFVGKWCKAWYNKEKYNKTERITIIFNNYGEKVKTTNYKYEWSRGDSADKIVTEYRFDKKVRQTNYNETESDGTKTGKVVIEYKDGKKVRQTRYKIKEVDGDKAGKMVATLDKYGEKLSPFIYYKYYHKPHNKNYNIIKMYKNRINCKREYRLNTKAVFTKNKRNRSNKHKNKIVFTKPLDSCKVENKP